MLQKWCTCEIFTYKKFLLKYRGHNVEEIAKQMCLGISSFDNVNSAGLAAGSSCAESGPQVASGFSLGSIFGGVFSGAENTETSGLRANLAQPTVACLFGDNLSLDSNGAGAGGETIFSGGSSGGGSCSGGGGMSLA